MYLLKDLRSFLSILKDLQIEIERMWKLKTTIVPVVIDALGVISKNVQKHIDKLSGTTWLAEVQNIVLNMTLFIPGF